MADTVPRRCNADCHEYTLWQRPLFRAHLPPLTRHSSSSRGRRVHIQPILFPPGPDAPLWLLKPPARFCPDYNQCQYWDFMYITFICRCSTWRYSFLGMLFCVFQSSFYGLHGVADFYPFFLVHWIDAHVAAVHIISIISRIRIDLCCPIGRHSHLFAHHISKLIFVETNFPILAFIIALIIVVIIIYLIWIFSSGPALSYLEGSQIFRRCSVNYPVQFYHRSLRLCGLCCYRSSSQLTRWTLEISVQPALIIALESPARYFFVRGGVGKRWQFSWAYPTLVNITETYTI